MEQYNNSAYTRNYLSYMLQNPEALEDDSPYRLQKGDFRSKLHWIIYSVAKTLYRNGTTDFTVAAIHNYLEQGHPESFRSYLQEGGDSVVQDMLQAKAGEMMNLEYNYGMAKKLSLLEAYSKAGVNVSDILDLTSFPEDDTTEHQMTEIEQISPIELADMIEAKVEKVRGERLEGYTNDNIQAGQGIDALDQSLREDPLYGPPLFDPTFSEVVMGARLGTLYLRSGSSGAGKAIPNYTLIPTPDGMRRVWGIKVGDYLFGKDGFPTKVLNVFPQGEKQVWKITFEDGRTVKCCEDHLWTYWLNGERHTESLKDMLDRWADKLIAQEPVYDFSIPNNEPVQYQKKEYDIDPYDMGRIIAEHGTPIPEEYMFGSVEQRENLLDGVLDQNRSNDFVELNERLAFDIKNLCHSLGIIATVKKENGTVPLYHINILEDMPDRCQIDEIMRTDEFTPMTCFTVDSGDHLFLMNDFITTHNTRISMADALTLSCEKYYDAGRGEWVNTGAQQNTLFVSVELDYDELQTMAVAFLSGVNEKKVIHPSLRSPEEEERIAEGMRMLKGASLWFCYLPNYNIQDIKSCLKTFIRTHHTNFIFLDYIATSMKIIEEVSKASRGMSMREDQVLHLLATELKQMAIDYHVCIISATQLNASYKTERILDQNALAGAKAIANRVDVGAVFTDCSPQDLDEIGPICGGMGLPNMKMSIYKNRRGEHTRIYLWLKADKGVCQYKTLFATDYSYNIIKIQQDIIEIQPDKVENIPEEELEVIMEEPEAAIEEPKVEKQLPAKEQCTSGEEAFGIDLG